MNTELPFFKFMPTLFTSGRISLQPFDIKGIFVELCCMYWANKGCLLVDELKLRYGDAIATLLKYEIIKDDNGKVAISFLDKQLEDLASDKEFLSKSGKKGAQKRWGDRVAYSPAYGNKEDRSKNKENNKRKFVPPSKQEVIDYFVANGYTKTAAERAFDYYDLAEPSWSDSKGNLVRSWKQKMRTVWFTDENKDKTKREIPEKPDPRATWNEKLWCWEIPSFF